MLKKHKTIKYKGRCVLKLKKVAMAIIVRTHLTSNVACFYSLEMFYGIPLVYWVTYQSI